MKIETFKKIIFLTTFLIITPVQSQKNKILNNSLWYEQPAKVWMQALPVGNGRLGAMVFGDPIHERIQLNEDSMWSGGPDWGDSKGTSKDLKTLRELIINGEISIADKFIIDKFSYKDIKRSHQTMGDLYIDFKNKNIKNYKRFLDLNQALVTVNYSSDGEEITEKVFASNPDNVLVIQLETSSNNGMDFSLKLDRPEDHNHKTAIVTTALENEIIMNGEVSQYGGIKFSKAILIDYGVKFETRLKVKTTGGVITSKDGQLHLKGVQKATIYIVCETSFYHKDYKKINAEHAALVYTKPYEELFQKHIHDYQQLFNRVSLDLGREDLNIFPTDIRLKKIKEGENDWNLVSKLFQYGRYLLISSSRPDTNPPNLQGIWNEHIEAPWNADYHLNINLQMNYWPAEVTNLSELHMPFFDLLDRVEKRGKHTAKQQYGINRGAVIHHTTDLWATSWMRASQPYWGSWVHGGGWSAQHYWEHYQYSQDIEFLKNRAYPFLKSIAEFYLDWLVWDDKTQTWISTPETSPENSYLTKDKRKASVSFGSAMGHQIISEVFDNVISAAKVLAYDDDFIKEVQEKRKKLHSGIKIGTDGRLLEWSEPYDEPEKGHRHMSHLYALHPSNKITIKNNPDAFEAAKKTIAYRLKNGGAGTGWSRVWMINLNARLFQNKEAEENIKIFLQKSVADNMFDMHPPFQIDGNFGFTAGIAELLLQSHEGFIRILPTLPLDWKNGKIKGLKARGAVTVDIKWQNKNLQTLTLKSDIDQTRKIIYKKTETELSMKKGHIYILNHALKPIQ